MNWMFRIGLALVGIGIIGGIVAGFATDWDFDRDRTVEYRIVNTSGEPATGDQPVLVVERDHDFPRRRFFPFAPLVVVGGVLIVVGLVTRGGRGGGPGGPWGHRSFEDWHRAAHATPEGPSTGAPPQ